MNEKHQGVMRVVDLEELYKMRVSTREQLAYFAEQCGHQPVIKNDKQIVLLDNPVVHWDPLFRNDQNHQILQAVIKKGDCRLFYDDSVDEFFIYQYTSEGSPPPLAHGANLNEVIIEAALNLWFPEDE